MAESLTRVPRAVKTASIRDTECAAIDIITDGEIRRESYSNRLATARSRMQTGQFDRAVPRSSSPPKRSRLRVACYGWP
jgi:5-methyltetrahydropteroyltriglutamate--homocysteine methyltransferase